MNRYFTNSADKVIMHLATADNRAHSPQQTYTY